MVERDMVLASAWGSTAATGDMSASYLQGGTGNTDHISDSTCLWSGSYVSGMPDPSTRRPGLSISSMIIYIIIIDSDQFIHCIIYSKLWSYRACSMAMRLRDSLSASLERLSCTAGTTRAVLEIPGSLVHVDGRIGG
jgi:hypothetical protein